MFGLAAFDIDKSPAPKFIFGGLLVFEHLGMGTRESDLGPVLGHVGQVLIVL